MDVISRRVERDKKFAKVAKGLQNNTITSSDLLAAALQRSASKAKKPNVLSKSPSKRDRHEFETGVCENLSKENLPSLNNVNPTPIELLSKHYREQYFANNRTADDSEEAGSSLYTSIMSTVENEASEVQQQQAVVDAAAVTIAEADHDSYDNNFDDNNMMTIDDNHSNPSNSIDTVKLEAEKCILHLLNHGSYDELLQLRGIGQTRAMKVMTVRNAGCYFASLQELEEIDMNVSAIKRFRRDNLGHLFA